MTVLSAVNFNNAEFLDVLTLDINKQFLLAQMTVYIECELDELLVYIQRFAVKEIDSCVAVSTYLNVDRRFEHIKANQQQVTNCQITR